MYKIISDGSCDLGESLAKELNVDVIPFYVTLDGKVHKKEIDELNIRDFYQFLVDNPKVFPKTSMPAIQDYIDVFTKEVKQGNDIICLCITTKFSGSYNSAMSARDIVLEEYPNNKITVIDTQINTVLQGLLVEEVVRMKEANYSYDQVINRIEEIKGSGRIFFTIDSMAYLVNGGRVGKLSGIAANVLNLRPLIILKNGEIESNGVVRGRKKAKSKIIEMVINHFIENNLNPNDYSFAVGFGYDMEEAILFKNELLSKINESFIYQEDIPLRQIGATIGVHTGPLPIGVGLIKKFNK